LIEQLYPTKTTAQSIIKNYVNLKILNKVNRQKRNRLFVFEEYINLFR
jgi:hypothetical protein